MAKEKFKSVAATPKNNNWDKLNILMKILSIALICENKKIYGKFE